MGLKIRRLKSGFAYYGEYKFRTPSGKQHCIYERVEAASAREAKRVYAARRKELEKQVPQKGDMAMLRVRDTRDRELGAIVTSLLHTLIDRGVFSEEDVSQLLEDTFRRQDRADRGLSYSETAMQAREAVRHSLREAFSGQYDGELRRSPNLVPANSGRLDG